MAASVENSEVYFAPKNHMKAASWSGYNEDQKAAALAHAKRVLNRAINSDDIEVDIDTTSAINPEYAIYEQALHMLIHQPVFNAERTYASPEAAAKPDQPPADAPLIAPEAIQWIVGNSLTYLSRG
jgi:hypothetical protein